MANPESLILGSEKLTAIFGYWPSFHDAEVLEMHVWRGKADPEATRHFVPQLTVKIHLWEMTAEINETGYFKLRHHTLVTLLFHGVDDFSMSGFNHQNAIFALKIIQQTRVDGPSPFFEVEFLPSYGVAALFTCAQIEVLEVVPAS